MNLTAPKTFFLYQYINKCLHWPLSLEKAQINFVLCKYIDIWHYDGLLASIWVSKKGKFQYKLFHLFPYATGFPKRYKRIYKIKYIVRIQNLIFFNCNFLDYIYIYIYSKQAGCWNLWPSLPQLHGDFVFQNIFWSLNSSYQKYNTNNFIQLYEMQWSHEAVNYV